MRVIIRMLWSIIFHPLSGGGGVARSSVVSWSLFLWIKEERFETIFLWEKLYPVVSYDAVLYKNFPTLNYLPITRSSIPFLSLIIYILLLSSISIFYLENKPLPCYFLFKFKKIMFLHLWLSFLSRV